MESKERPLAPFKKDLGQPFKEGSRSRVFPYGEIADGLSVVVKEEKSEYAPPLLKCLEKFMALKREKLSRFLEKILGPQFKIRIDFDLVKNGVAEYFLMSQYFRRDENDTGGSRENREELTESLENPEDPFHGEMRDALGDQKSVALLAGIAKKHQKDNFLPREIGTVIGHPSDLTAQKAAELKAAGKKLPSTFYIVQEAIKGKKLIPLLDLDDNELRKRPDVLEKLLMFAVLTKKMYADTGKMIDLRPEEILKNPFEFFQKTANVLVNLDEKEGKSGVYFVDNRWLWDKKSRVGEGGINFIKFLGVASIDRAIKKYLGLLEQAKKKTDD